MCWYSEQDRRACTVPNPFCKNHPDSGCTEYVLVTPAYLADLEQRYNAAEALLREVSGAGIEMRSNRPNCVEIQLDLVTYRAIHAYMASRAFHDYLAKEEGQK
jgi:hypothetical protein